MLHVSLNYDPLSMFGKKGREAFVRSWTSRMDQAKASLHQKRDALRLGWIDLPSDQEVISRVSFLAKKVKKFDTLVVVGIGGSDLGARAILQALPTNKRVIFMGDTTDPDAIHSALLQIDWKKTIVNIVSKSGDTVESMTVFFVLRDRMRRVIGRKFFRQIVATTDMQNGTLHNLARKEGYHALPVPTNVVGRFSVLSDVGLFPAAWAGVNIRSLLRGAAAMVRHFETQPADQELSALFAAIHAEHMLEHHRYQFVLMPYASHLMEFGRWYRQLLAESLGKKPTSASPAAFFAPTPVVFSGPMDQHSQLQLYRDGPDDKIYTFLTFEAHRSPLRIPRVILPSKSLAQLSGRFFADVLHAEAVAVQTSLVDVGRPVGHLSLPKLDAFSLGELFQFFFFVTAYLGEFFSVCAYDQPGVEDGKKRFWQWAEEH